MASSNKTTNANLSQFLGSDKPKWLEDYNADMQKIDAKFGEVPEPAATPTLAEVQAASVQEETMALHLAPEGGESTDIAIRSDDTSAEMRVRLGYDGSGTESGSCEEEFAIGGTHINAICSAYVEMTNKFKKAFREALGLPENLFSVHKDIWGGAPSMIQGSLDAQMGEVDQYTDKVALLLKADGVTHFKLSTPSAKFAFGEELVMSPAIKAKFQEVLEIGSGGGGGGDVIPQQWQKTNYSPTNAPTVNGTNVLSASFWGIAPNANQIGQIVTLVLYASGATNVPGRMWLCNSEITAVTGTTSITVTHRKVQEIQNAITGIFAVKPMNVTAVPVVEDPVTGANPYPYAEYWNRGMKSGEQAWLDLIGTGAVAGRYWRGLYKYQSYSQGVGLCLIKVEEIGGGGGKVYMSTNEDDSDFTTNAQPGDILLIYEE